MTKAHDDGAFEALWRELDALPRGQKGEIVAGRVRLLPRPVRVEPFDAIELALDRRWSAPG